MTDGLLGAASGRFLCSVLAAILLPDIARPEAAQFTPDTERAVTTSMNDVASVIDQHADALMQLDDVIGVAESRCNGAPCIKVLLRRNNPATRAAIPAKLDGVPVIVEVSGPIVANPE